MFDMSVFMIILALAAPCSSFHSTGVRFGSQLRSKHLLSERSTQTAVEPSTTEETTTGPSALVVGWFGAKDNELEFVKKIYKKKGYSEVTVTPSIIAACSKPRGWYRTVKETSAKHALVEAGGDCTHPLSRRFDVVHVLSGGFLNLYLQLLAGARINFDTLVLDSTPILPKPSSFTRFARAYMETMPKPLNLIPKLVPAWLHLAYVTCRWSVSSTYVGVRHQLSRLFQKLRPNSPPTPGSFAGPQLLGSFAPFAATNRYDAVVNNCVETVFEKSRQYSDSAEQLKAVFVTNPADPYLNYDDVKATMKRASELGCDVHEVQGYKEHVKSIFRKPAAIFGGPLEPMKETPPPPPTGDLE